MKVAYAGEPGAFGEQAARAVAANAEPCPFPSFEAVAEAVARGEIDAGVIPIENSIAGAVAEGVSALLRAHPPVRGEVRVRVRHLLLAPDGATLETVSEVHSHPQALAQCRRFLEAHRLRSIPEANTATAARLVAQGRWPHGAAIASQAAAERFGLSVLAEDIADAADNETRFYVLGRGAPPSWVEVGVFAILGEPEELAPGTRRIGRCTDGELVESDGVPNGARWLRLGGFIRTPSSAQDPSASKSS